MKFYIPLEKSNKLKTGLRLILLVVILLCGHLTLSVAGPPSNNPEVAPQNIICDQAPWNRKDDLDQRAEGIRKASEWASPTSNPDYPISKLSGVWKFQLEDLASGGGTANEGRLVFYQDKPGQTNAKWLVSGKRWGHQTITKEKPHDIPPGFINVTASGNFKIPQPQHYPFPEISARFDPANPDNFTGTWSLIWRGKTFKTGKATFTRIVPKITKVKYISTLKHEVGADEIGCAAPKYRGWGKGNNMPGNRPTFNVEIYGENFFWHAEKHYKIFIDPETGLQVTSGYPKVIFARNPNGKPDLSKVVGLLVNFTIWSQSKWGPKRFFVEGQPITFDFYVKPQYYYQVNPVDLQLIEGHFPEKPFVNQPTNVGFRLVYLPGHKAKHTELDLEFLDAKDFSPAQEIKIRDKACKLTGNETVRCSFDETAIAGLEEIEFEIPMPAGGLRWTAQWKTKGDDPDGHLRVGVIQPEPSPRILHTFSLSNQTGAFRPQTRDYLFPYTGTGGVQQKREIIIFGNNLPQKFGDEARIQSLDPSISYLPRYGTAYQNRYDAAWEDLSKRFKTPVPKLKTGHQLLLLEAKVKGKILPGEKSLKLNDATASWDLRFGGLKANLEFIREVGDQPAEVLDSAYVPERVRIRVTTSSPLPLDHIPLILHLQRTNRNPEPLRIARGEPSATTLNKISLTATTTAGNPTVYLSEPIRMIDKGNPRLSPPPRPGDIPVEIFNNSRGPDQLAVEIKPSFAKKSFLMPILPASAALPISSTPARHRSARDPIQTSDYLFKSALQRAAQCRKDIKVESWDALSLEQAEAFYNLVIFTHGDHLRRTKVRFAHHAAMLLMRDRFIELLNDQMLKNNQVLGSQLALKGFMKIMRLEMDNDSIPINRIKVSAPDGSIVSYGGMPLYENLDFLAKKFNKTPQEIAKWRLAATAEAIARIGGAASEAAAKARQVDPCDIEGLLKLTGRGFEAVQSQLKPRLMRLVETRDPGNRQRRLYWEPDLAARYWIKDVARVLKRLEAQRQTARDDNTRLTVLFSIVTAPIIAGGTSITSILLTGANLTLLGADTAGEWAKVYESNIELDFSRDAAVVLGFSRNQAAVKKAVTWQNAYNKTLLALGLATIDLFQVKEAVATGLFRSKEIFLKGRLSVRNLPEGGLRALSIPEQRNVMIFALRARVRALTQGAEALDPLERQALLLMDDEFRSAKTALIQETDSSRTLGFGDVLPLPQPLGPKTAMVRFEPVDLAAARAGRIPEPGSEPIAIQMARAGGEPGSSSTVLSGTAPLWRHTGNRPPPLVDDPLDLALFKSTTMEERIQALWQKEIILSLRNQADRIIIKLGEAVGWGSFKGVFAHDVPWEEFPTVAKLAFESGHGKAEVIGKALLKEVNSNNIVLPREVFRADIPADVVGHQRHFTHVAIVERLEGTAKEIVKNNPGGVMTRAQRDVYKDALDDINDSGIVWLDCKRDQFTWVERDDQLKLGILDYGNFFRVKGGDPKLAREIQNVVNGPIDPVIKELERLGRYSPDLRTFSPHNLNETLNSVRARGLRFELITTKYADAFENLEEFGITHIRQFDFAPVAGDQFSQKAAYMFTKEKRLK